MKGQIQGKLRVLMALTIVTFVVSMASTSRTFAKATARPSLASHRCIRAAGSGDQTFVRNFNPYSNALDFARGGIYEPLFVLTDRGGGHKYMWLATKLQWSKNLKTLYIFLRQGVKWSDGVPFTSKDVVFTLTAGKINAGLDQIGYVSSTNNIASIKPAGTYEVMVNFKRPDTTFLTLLSTVFIVPQHIWSKVKDPTKYIVTKPVGTGPFTTVASFGPQDYVLAKNPHYWQAGKPAAPCLERVAAATNDSALLMMVSGDVDWTHNFVPDVQDVYSKKDPAHFHYFYGSKTPVGIFFDDTKYPYSLPAFRRAISLALDRQRVYKVGEYGYEPPADALGILRQYPTWLDPKLAKEDKQLVQFDPQKAHSALAAAGFTWKDGNLIDPHGNAVSMEFHVIAGWSDWVLSLQIIEEDLKNIGIDASVKLDPDWGTWSPIAYSSSQPHLMWTIASGPNPFTYFDTLLDKANVVPSGQQQPSGNWNHFYDLQATTILNDFRATASKKQQRADMYKLEAIFLKDFPYVPVVDSAIWYTYSTKYFTGWPDKKNDYANGIFNQYPDNVVILTRLAPVK